MIAITQYDIAVLLASYVRENDVAWRTPSPALSTSTSTYRYKDRSAFVKNRCVLCWCRPPYCVVDAALRHVEASGVSLPKLVPIGQFSISLLMCYSLLMYDRITQKILLNNHSCISYVVDRTPTKTLKPEESFLDVVLLPTLVCADDAGPLKQHKWRVANRADDGMMRRFTYALTNSEREYVLYQPALTICGAR